MAFIDGLQDSATFQTISYTEDGMGNQTKDTTDLYVDIPCRFHLAGGKRFGDGKNPSEQDPVRDEWVVMVEPQYDGAVRDDRVIIRNQIYIITKKQVILGDNPAPNHITYYVKEQD